MNTMSSNQGSARWQARRAGLLGMPGGYDGYLVSLRRVAEYLDVAQPTPEQLQSWMRDQFAITAGSAYSRWRSLCRAGLLTEADCGCVLTDACAEWRLNDDPAQLMTQVHRNIRFFGELLALLDNPKTTEELRHAANERYPMGWQATTQINMRRGWLQSAGMIELDEATGRLVRTEAGTVLLDALEVEPPLA